MSVCRGGQCFAWALVGLLFCLTGPSVADEYSSSAAARERLYEELAQDVAAFESQGNLLKRVVRLVKPAVVHISARKPVSEYGRREEEAGSGVIVAIDGGAYVLTNRHVVHDSPLRNIDIQLADGEILHPSKVLTDIKTDVAVMRVTRRDLTKARLGSSEDVEIGDFVLAVGSPFGLSHSVTYGIISAKGRRDLELGNGQIQYQDFMQTDAAINPGNSGGPLLNLRGEVIGINTAIASASGGNEGIGFTMPIDMAITVARQLVKFGRPMRAYLGVVLNSKFNQRDATRLGLARARGAHVKSVTAGSPAAQANVRVDDVVVEFDGKSIEDDDHLIRIVGFTEIGKTVDLVVLRGGRRIALRVPVVDRSRFESR